MARVFFEEEQRFSNQWWIWLATLAILIVPIVVILQQEAIEKDMLKVFLSTGVSLLPVIGILYFSRLQVRIDQEGLHYKFFPAVMKWRLIPKNSIESFEVSEKRNFYEKLECGYNNNRWCHTISMNVCGKKFARIKLLDGRKFKIGSENPESFERALRKLTTTENEF